MPFKPPVRLNQHLARQLLADVDNFLFDCDGVIWNWPSIIPGSIELINKLKKLNKNCFFITNNSTKTRDTYVEMLKKVGVNDVTEKEIVCTAWTLATYLKSINFTDKCYVIGSQGIAKELEKAKIKFFGVGPNSHQVPDPGAFDYKTMQLDPEVKCVAVGFDHYFNYPKLVEATSYAHGNPSCLFIATNDDAQLPAGPHSKISIPGTGTMVNAVKTSVGREPLILGKPYRTMWDVLQKEHNLDPARSCMIGDRLDTDIALAANCSLGFSLAVLTGVAREDDILRLGKLFEGEAKSNLDELKCVPDLYAQSLGEFGEFIQDV